MSDKPIQLGYARPMPADRRRISPLTLIVTLLLTLATTCITCVMVMYFLLGQPRGAMFCGFYGAGFALLATLWSMGRSRGMLRSNLALFAASIADIISAAWMS